MKKYIVPFILTTLTLMLTGCGRSPARIPLSELPADYSLEQAKEDGCVIHENGDVTQGKEEFEAFYRATKLGRADEIRLAFYYTLGDPSGYAPEYYESVKDEYPVLYTEDLSFDGDKYTLRVYADGEEYVSNYQYLMKYEGEAESPNALFKSYVRYVLTNDDTVTWDDVLHGLYSSQLGDYIEHKSVCTDLIYE